MVATDRWLRSRRLLIVVPLIFLVIIGLIVSFIGFPLGPTQGFNTNFPTPIKSCRTISQSGDYVLTEDFGGATRLSNNCLIINASSVHIDGAGHTIKGRGVVDTTGILITSRSGLSDVTINSVRAAHWDRAIFIKNMSSVTIQNVSVNKNAEGISIWNSNDVTIEHTRSTHNLFGILVDNRSQDVHLSTVQFRNNGVNITHGRSPTSKISA